MGHSQQIYFLATKPIKSEEWGKKKIKYMQGFKKILSYFSQFGVFFLLYKWRHRFHRGCSSGLMPTTLQRLWAAPRSGNRIAALRLRPIHLGPCKLAPDVFCLYLMQLIWIHLHSLFLAQGAPWLSAERVPLQGCLSGSVLTNPIKEKH